MFATVTGVADALWRGIQLGLQYNPVFGIIGAVIAAALLGYARAPRDHQIWAEAAIAVAWLAGDGMQILGRAHDAVDGVGAFARLSPTWSAYVLLVTWALVTIALGYIAPAWAGIIVGRRVTHGTGWLAAISIAVAVSLALSTLVASLGTLV